MTYAPGTTDQTVSYVGLHARQPHRAALLHTNGGGTDNGSLYGWWSQIAARGQHVGAHYQVATDGRVFGYVNPSSVIYHAFGASEWAIGIETQDDGHPDTPWTEAQMRSIAKVLRFHGVPARQLTSAAPGDGVGWHAQFPEWNQDAHDCVGHVRQAQIPHVLSLVAQTPTPPGLPAWYRRVLLDLGPGKYLVGADVAHVQAAVRTRPADGVYGPGTAAAVKAWQARHGLTADGIVGPNTARKLG